MTARISSCTDLWSCKCLAGPFGAEAWGGVVAIPDDRPSQVPRLSSLCGRAMNERHHSAAPVVIWTDNREVATIQRGNDNSAPLPRHP